MIVATDRSLNDFFGFLGRQLGLANVWIVLSADHGVAPTIAQAQKLKIPNATTQPDPAKAEINAGIAKRVGRAGDFVALIRDRIVYLNPEAFGANFKRDDAEAMLAEIMQTPSVRQKLEITDAMTRAQINGGRTPANELSRKWAHSYAPGLNEWYAIGLPAPFSIPGTIGADHLAPWSYDTHVPLGFYGIPFQPGTYRQSVEPVDWTVTLASLLGINKPSHAVGRVLVEALKEQP